MNDAVYTVALAGLLHDVGKFAERAGMELTPGYEQGNAGLYQPYHDGQKRHTHRHALYTAAFLERVIGQLPPLAPIGDARQGNSFINLAAMHHKPETPLQWIITMADRLSSGLDRQEFGQDSQFVPYRDFRKTRLLPLAEKMCTGGDHMVRQGYRHCYRLAELGPDAMFPVERSAGEPASDEAARAEYRALLERFLSAFGTLENRETVHLWMEHCESLFQTFTAHIPAATVERVIPDVSLFDHAKATAALATALYLYHTASATLTVTAVCDEKPAKFLLISGDFYGIQDFIFAEGGNSNRAAAKLLRGRSFAVSLHSELVAELVCKRLGLPSTSVILSAAGKFTILAPNLPESAATVTQIETEINDWLVKHYHGQVSMGFSTVTASPVEFKCRNFVEFWGKLAASGDRKKFGKIDLERHGGSVEGFLDSFDNTLGICPFCGRRPAQTNIRINRLLPEATASCGICRDHVFLGSKLVKEERLAIFEAATTGDDLLAVPIFGIYQVVFGTKNGSVPSGALRKVWNIGLDPHGHRIARRFLSGYVPRYQEADNHDDRLLKGTRSERKTVELIEMIKEGGAKSFQHIATSAINPETMTGIEALGILKADVDNLGKIFACGLPEDQFNLSRLATFSRQMNAYFSLWLPHLFATDVRFNTIYTVFAGGDDLFLIGPWNRIVDFAEYLRSSFGSYVCDNPAITISAGISINKPGVPIPALSSSAEVALEKAKNGGRNAITLFGESVAWPEFARLQIIRDQLRQWQQQGLVNKAMLYRLNGLLAMAAKEQQLLRSGKAIDLRDMECLKWRARLVYSVTRNVGKSLSGAEKNEAIGKVKESLLDWLHTHQGAFKMALWQVLYEQR